MEKIFWASTYLGFRYDFPGTKDNPMRPELFEHPITGEIHQAHYNSRNLITNKDYEAAGFRFIDGRGWCYPVLVDVPYEQKTLAGIQL